MAMNPTLNFQVGNVSSLPIMSKFDNKESVNIIARDLIYLSKNDWDSSETSWDFPYFPLFSSYFPLLENKGKKEEKSDEALSPCVFDPSSLSVSYTNYRSLCQNMTDTMKNLEEENNRIFIDAYGLGDELTPDVPINEITLFANPKYRYKGDLSASELESRFKADTMQELMSYAIGCIMGRYSLDQPGLVYAHSANVGFDPSRYKTFPADSDGIIPITDSDWFDDDIALRFVRFIGTAWDKNGLENNLDFIADAIGTRSDESSRDAIRRYFVSDFFKDHLQKYKKRPIYWLFSSGKQKAFQALVYLHRYNEGTLARMRTEYVLPLQSMLTRRIENLDKDRQSASSTSAANKIQKEMDSLRKQRDELLSFDEKLRHYADMKIKLDLDDGVKVNYGKFGDLLAEVKAITGSSE